MITIVVIVLSVLGASYAYFAGSIANNAVTTISAKTNTIDQLVFAKGSSLQWAYSFGNQNNASLGTYDTKRHIIRMDGRRSLYG